MRGIAIVLAVGATLRVVRVGWDAGTTRRHSATGLIGAQALSERYRIRRIVEVLTK